MVNKKPLTSKISNNITIVMGLLISLPILCFITPMFIAIIIEPFRPGPVAWTDIIAMFFGGSIFMSVPIYLLSIIFRMRHIYIIDSGLYFNSQTFPWKDIEKIKHPIGDCGKFTIVYKKNNKRKKVFGALFLFGLFGSTPVIYKLYNIAETQNIPIIKTWRG